MAELLMYHQRLPSPAPIFVSHDAQSKSLLSLRMVKGMVPVSPTGTSASLPNIEVMGTTYRTCDCMRRSNIIFESHLSNQAARAENIISVLCNLNSISDSKPICNLCNLDKINRYQDRVPRHQNHQLLLPIKTASKAALNTKINQLKIILTKST